MSTAKTVQDAFPASSKRSLTASRGQIETWTNLGAGRSNGRPVNLRNFLSRAILLQCYVSNIEAAHEPLQQHHSLSGGRQPVLRAESLSELAGQILQVRHQHAVKLLPFRAKELVVYKGCALRDVHSVVNLVVSATTAPPSRFYHEK